MKFAKTVIALAAGMAALASAQAQAADYLIYSFTFTGTETRTSNAVPGTGNSVAQTGSIVYYLPTSFAGLASSSVDVGASFMAPDRIAGAVSGSMFTFTEQLSGLYTRPSTRDVSISACLAGGIPGPTVAIDPSCSSVSVTDRVSLGTLGGDLRTITGTLTGLSVAEGYGSVKFGLTSYPLIPVTATPTPEAATWAMMILGLGAVGTMLRRRNRTVAVA